MRIEAEFSEKLGFLFEPCRYKVAYGGRAGTKSWGFARALLILAVRKKLRILCTRETQASIRESVHQVLSDQIKMLGLQRFFEVQQFTIRGTNGSEFIFGGLRQNANNLKSYEGCDIVWIEEAQNVTKRSLDDLIPTIRKEGSEIWISFNPEFEDDEVYQRFIVGAPTNAQVIFTTYRDNPWLTETMKQEISEVRRRSEDDYQHIYEGKLRQTVQGAIYKRELEVVEVEHRFRNIPHDTSRPVSTFWDIGPAHTAIWFAQTAPFEFHLIDYLEGELQSLAFYMKALQEKPYTYGIHWLPWDGERTELGTGRSIKEQMRSVFGAERVRCARKMLVEDGIEAVRALLSRCFFDRERCKPGIRALRCYQYEYDKELRTYKRNPLHDWASHGADAFRTLAVAIKEPEVSSRIDKQPEIEYRERQTDGAWMQ